MSNQLLDLNERRLALLAEQPKMRARDVAVVLNVSEAELLVCSPDDGLKCLDMSRLAELLMSLFKLGNVMGLTRNDFAVHEKHGEYSNLTVNGMMGLALGVIDLRLFLSRWKYGFAVSSKTKGGERKSLQFFDHQGTAIHKIYLTNKSNQSAYTDLVNEFFEPGAVQPLDLQIAPVAAEPDKDATINIDALRRDWTELKDVHDFHGLLRKHNVERLQAFRLVGSDYAFPVEARATRNILQTVAMQKIPIMVFVGNQGMIQIHTGAVANLREVGPWYNVLDPEFNLHLREDGIAASWVVRKPTVDGEVTSLEIYDKQGRNIAMFFGERKPGRSQLPEWHDLLMTLRAGRETVAA